MTEDDTFRLLRRIPFEEMLKILLDRGFVSITNVINPTLAEFGWTQQEFIESQKEYVRRIDR